MQKCVHTGAQWDKGTRTAISNCQLMEMQIKNGKSDTKEAEREREVKGRVLVQRNCSWPNLNLLSSSQAQRLIEVR